MLNLVKMAEIPLCYQVLTSSGVEYAHFGPYLTFPLFSLFAWVHAKYKVTHSQCLHLHFPNNLNCSSRASLARTILQLCRMMQEVALDSKIMLLDSPGICMATGDASETTIAL